MRAQHAYPPAPAGFRDEDFVYTFDSINTPALAQNIAAGAAIPNIGLRLDRDAPFILRGVKLLTDQPDLGAEFRGPDGELLSDDYQPVALSFFPSGTLIVGTPPVPVEPAVECPLGAVILLDLADLSGGGIRAPRTAVLLLGVKRWKMEGAHES